MLSIQTFTHEPFQVNTHLVWNAEDREALLVNTARDPDNLLSFVQEHELNLENVFHTHGFLELLEGQTDLRDEIDGLTCHMNPMDEFWLAHLDTQATMLNVDRTPQPFIDQQILPEDVVAIGSIQVHALATPGCSPGSLSYYLPQAGAVFVGDVLHAGGIGPVDIPHGSREVLVASIQDVLFALPDETRIFPSRGPATTVAEEKARNTLEPRPYGKALSF